MLFFIFKSQRRAETWNLQSSQLSVPTTSNYFTSILPSPATGHHDEIQMKDMGQIDEGSGSEVVYSGHDHVSCGELIINGVDSSVEEREHSYVERSY